MCEDGGERDQRESELLKIARARIIEDYQSVKQEIYPPSE